MSGQHPRGVFHQEYSGPGEVEVLVAVDRHGRCLARVTVPAEADRDAVVRRLRSLLRVLDPMPRLDVVDGGAARPASPRDVELEVH